MSCDVFPEQPGLTGLWLCGSVIDMRCTDMFILYREVLRAPQGEQD